MKIGNTIFMYSVLPYLHGQINYKITKVQKCGKIYKITAEKNSHCMLVITSVVKNFNKFTNIFLSNSVNKEN